MINNPNQFAQFSQIVNLKKKPSEINPAQRAMMSFQQSLGLKLLNNQRVESEDAEEQELIRQIQELGEDINDDSFYEGPEFQNWLKLNKLRMNQEQNLDSNQSMQLKFLSQENNLSVGNRRDS